MDEYLTSVREVEQTVKRCAYWADRPKPQVDYEIENFDRKSVDDYVGTLMDLAVLALQTDSTHAVTVQIPFWEGFKEPDLSGNYHDLSHNGQKPEKIKKLHMQEHGFDKFGKAHLISPHQVMAYLKTARFIAERVLPNAKPETRTWEFDARHFHGSKNFATGGGGDYRDGDDYVLTGFRPYLNNLHFSIDPERHDQFVIPAFGTYRLEVEADSEKSKEGEVIGITRGTAVIRQAFG